MKRLWKYAAALLLAVTLSIPCTAAAARTPGFSDVPETHWAAEEIWEACRLGIAEGMGYGRFAPDEVLTAGAFLTMLGRAVYPADCAEEEGEPWWAPGYDAALKFSLLTPEEFPRTEEAMAVPLTRYQTARLLCRTDQNLFGTSFPLVSLPIPFSADYDQIPEAYAYDVSFVYARELMHGDAAERFNGESSLTRAEAAAVLLRLLEKRPDHFVGETVSITVTGQVILCDGEERTPCEGIRVTLQTSDNCYLISESTDQNGCFSITFYADRACLVLDEPGYTLTASRWIGNRLYHGTVRPVFTRVEETAERTCVFPEPVIVELTRI